MIKINLAKRKTAAFGTSQPTSSAGDLLSQLRGMLKRTSGGSRKKIDLKELPLFSVLISLAGIYGSEWYFNDLKTNALQQESARISKQQSLQAELQKKLEASVGLDETKNSLTADLNLISTKLETLKQLMSKREVGLHLLRDVSSSIPLEVWLISATMSDDELTLGGQAIELNHVSDFMKDLEKSQLLSELTLVSSNQIKNDREELVAAFSLKAKRN